MGKSDVYSWRVSAEVKAALEYEARREGVSLAGLLERISSEWLDVRRSANGTDAAEQRRLHATVSRCFGSIAGGDPSRSARSRQIVRERLAQRLERVPQDSRASRVKTNPKTRRSTANAPQRPKHERSKAGRLRRP